MIRKFCSKAIGFLQSLRFIFENISHAAKLSEITSLSDGAIVIRGLRSADNIQVNKIIYLLNNGVGFGFSRRFLYRIVGSRLVFVAERKEDGEIVGVNLFYFNARDRVENTIHEGFIGVVPSHQGKGVASKLRRHAIESFTHAELSGISTRISISNTASFRSAEKMGFRVDKRYVDSRTGEERCYLICHF